MTPPKSYLVTGGAGFIGSHIVQTLVGRGAAVRVLDNFLTGKRENLAPFRDKIELVEGDLRNPEDCRTAARGVESVLHLGAVPSVPRSVEDPRTTNDVNVGGTLNMLIAARDAGARSFVLASSSSVYGDDPVMPKVEGREGVPLSPYAVSKLAGEKYCQTFYKLFGLRAVSLRYFNVFGPRQDPASQYAAAVPLFVTRALRNEPPTIFGDGEQSRDFTYIDNVVAANLLAAASPRVTCEVMNVACGDPITVNALAATILEVVGSPAVPVHVPERKGDIRHSYADISRARAVLGFAPSVGFQEGLRRTIAWYRERSSA